MWYWYTCSIFVCGLLHRCFWTYCKIRAVPLSLTLLNVIRKKSARKKSFHKVSRSHFLFPHLHFVFTLDGLSEKGTTLSLAFLLLMCKQRLISIALEMSKKSSFVSGLVCHDSGSQNKLMQIMIFIRRLPMWLGSFPSRQKQYCRGDDFVQSFYARKFCDRAPTKLTAGMLCWLTCIARASETKWYHAKWENCRGR